MSTPGTPSMPGTAPSSPGAPSGSCRGTPVTASHLGRWLDNLATEKPLWRDYHPLASAEQGEYRHPSFP
jgi:hypothetical protein